LESAYFQVIGEAAGNAFAWRVGAQLGADERYGKSVPLPAGHGKSFFLPGEKIIQDLTFYPERLITGRVVSEAGVPIDGVTVRLSELNHAKYGELYFGEEQARGLWPDRFKAISNAEGTFVLPALPAGLRANLSLGHRDYANSGMGVTVPESADEADRPLEVKLNSVRSVTVSLLEAATGKAVPGGRVTAREKPSLAEGSWASSAADENGRAVLKLPPGKYTLSGYPPERKLEGPQEIALNYASQELVVAEDPREQSVELKLPLGSLLVLKAVDADTGKPIEGIEFMYRSEGEEGFHQACRSWRMF
jgi:hypothetical protein